MLAMTSRPYVTVYCAVQGSSAGTDLRELKIISELVETIIADDTESISFALEHLTLHNVPQEQVKPMLLPLATNTKSMCGQRFETCR